jgi:alginate O-acetyltransferase complex protein AlgI
MTLRNLFITMALGGLWHGAQWTFVVWGLYHGLLMVIHGVSKMMRFPVWPHPAGVLGTFLAVHFGWVLFRAPTFGNDKAKVTRRDHAKVTHPG